MIWFIIGVIFTVAFLSYRVGFNIYKGKIKLVKIEKDGTEIIYDKSIFDHIKQL